MRASLSEFVEEIGYEDVGRLPREFAAAAELKRRQGRGKAVRFLVEGSEQEAVGNVVDNRDKVIKALSASDLRDAYRRVLKAMSEQGELREVGMPRLREASRGLLSLPAVKFYERDGGLYLSSAMFIACYDGVCNASIHRVMLLGERRAAVRLVPRHLWYLYNKAMSRGEPLPVTVVVGVHPAVLLAAASSPPLGFFELRGASAMVGGLEVFRSPLHGNPVPAGASAVVEGYLTSEQADEGPFVEAMGGYDRVRKQPVLEVRSVLINPDEVSHVILPGGLEHGMLMGFPREAAIYDAVSRVVPEVVAVRLTPASGTWLHAVISIRKSHDGDAKNAIMAAFAAHPSLKHVVVVDDDINVDDPYDVEWAIATRFQADRGLVIVTGARGSTLDPSSSQDGLTAKVGVDATKPMGQGERFERARIPGL
ncbi:UbiD 3-octaprenyl-4-hydroxybenzoate carboxylyase [Acidilobus saccharovorans 345-15]|uniref:Anhydromevalonate phosphate decarboxylase n=1 Tax=Acidilobus saccharovorans (strain DSM 16705 / JCM 18335 / VKM B-2471 / 345-15) TaxID=666510 RepID=D9PYY7_ACIS3|nr:UbiD family decarboxylase [Acidilobus saccharovorans]ADL19774.1 UbiD 3-octaprenyl-4-hydroxybenzoate carboxylyase [Acidilobus saccharovorans 345-15]